MGVYNMTFSKDQRYLLIQYQIIDNELMRSKAASENLIGLLFLKLCFLLKVNNDPQSTYQVWDLNENVNQNNYEVFKTIEWTRYNFPNALNCQYQFYQNFLLSGEDALLYI